MREGGREGGGKRERRERHKRQELVNKVVMKGVVNRVAKSELADKMTMCGRAAPVGSGMRRYRINPRQKVYKTIVNGREDYWDEYCRVRGEVTQLFIEKMLNIWNEIVEKVNTDLHGNGKEFWDFLGRRTKDKKYITSLKSDTVSYVHNKYKR